LVDCDVFRAHVEPGFRTASRAVFDRSDPVAGIERTLFAGSVLLKNGGCPGLIEIETLVLEHFGRSASPADRDSVFNALNNVKRAFANDRTSSAVETAKQYIRTAANSDGQQFDGSIQHPDSAQRLVEKIVIAALDERLFPGPLLQDLVESGRETWDSWRERRAEFLRDLQRTDGLAKLATELRTDLYGRHVKRQVAKRPKVDQGHFAMSHALT